MDDKEVAQRFESLDGGMSMLVGTWQALEAMLVSLIETHPDPKGLSTVFEAMRQYGQSKIEAMEVPEAALDSYRSAAEQFEQQLRARLEGEK